MFKYSVNIGKWVRNENRYLVNFYIRQIGGTFATPPLVLSAAMVLAAISQISAHS